MNPEVQRLAFEPFFTTRSTEGAPARLSLAQEIVQRYRGTIALSSAEAWARRSRCRSHPSPRRPRARPPSCRRSSRCGSWPSRTSRKCSTCCAPCSAPPAHGVHGCLRPRGARAVRARDRRSGAHRPRHAGDDRLALAEQLKRQRAIPIVLLTGWPTSSTPRRRRRSTWCAKPFTRERLFEAWRTLPTASVRLEACVAIHIEDRRCGLRC